MQRNEIIQPGEPSKFDSRGRGRSSSSSSSSRGGALRHGDREEDGWGDDLGRRWHFVESLEGDSNAELPLGASASGVVPDYSGAEGTATGTHTNAPGDKVDKTDRSNNSLFSKWSSRRARERVEREREKEREHVKRAASAEKRSVRASSPRTTGVGGGPRTPHEAKVSLSSTVTPIGNSRNGNEPSSSTPSPNGGSNGERGDAADAARDAAGRDGDGGERDAAGRRISLKDTGRTPTPLGSPPIPRRRAPTSEIIVYLDDIANTDDGMVVLDDAASGVAAAEAASESDVPDAAKRTGRGGSSSFGGVGGGGPIVFAKAKGAAVLALGTSFLASVVKRSKNKTRMKRESSQDLIEAISPHAIIAHGAAELPPSPDSGPEEEDPVAAAVAVAVAVAAAGEGASEVS